MSFRDGRIVLPREDFLLALIAGNFFTQESFPHSNPSGQQCLESLQQTALGVEQHANSPELPWQHVELALQERPSAHTYRGTFDLGLLDGVIIVNSSAAIESLPRPAAFMHLVPVVSQSYPAEQQCAPSQQQTALILLQHEYDPW